MTEDDLTPEQRAARDELGDLLQRHASLLGPWRETTDMPDPGPTVFLDGWVLMASWTGADGEGWVTRIPSKRLRNHERVGLLHEGLYGFDGG